jgi:subtilisin family serine protease
MDYTTEDRSPDDKDERQIPRAEERLSRLINMAHAAVPKTLKDASSHDAPKESSVPGVVHVVLKEGVDGRRIAKRFNDGDDHGEHDANFSVLMNLLRQHRIVRVEATFDATPPGLEPEENPPAGRERYLTLYFATEQNTRVISNKLRDTALVERASPAPKIIPSSSPLSEPLLNPTMGAPELQWYIPRCKADLGWQLRGPAQFYSGQGVVVADIDWGFYEFHQELAGRIERSYNSITGGTFVGDGNLTNHGTAALALAGAAANGQEMVGFAFGADLWAIQADDGSGLGSFQNWRFAIDYVRCTDSGGRRKVICLEAETADYCNVESDEIINKAVRDAIDAGVVVCVAGGNGDREAEKDAAGIEFTETGSILVGSTLYHANPLINTKNGSSNWGPRIVVSAPGDPSNDWSASSVTYAHFGGTSGATPKVAGTIALMLEANPQLSHAEVRDILSNTGTAIDAPAGHPIGTFLNAAAAVAEAQRRAAAPPPSLATEIAAPTIGKEKLAESAAESRTIAPSGK